ncbi:hypothetical protein DMH04_19185 [Kibdelosporangium aridum]|uniref:Uncharacterized protein n=1 Tax=Kibdelosporangium aridum TaxID=2030 RepID=A0A428ZA89_KIBAR|nr:hypothetical protein [Kibdelosporangium aridum]RSM84982.1 hypothetical protein DMH04_19185 [Kibdelosporangium aridum]
MSPSAVGLGSAVDSGGSSVDGIGGGVEVTGGLLTGGRDGGVTGGRRLLDGGVTGGSPGGVTGGVTGGLLGGLLGGSLGGFDVGGSVTWNRVWAVNSKLGQVPVIVWAPTAVPAGTWAATDPLARPGAALATRVSPNSKVIPVLHNDSPPLRENPDQLMVKLEPAGPLAGLTATCGLGSGG